MMIKRLAITAGEPAGIGPDLIVQLAQQSWEEELVVFADPKLLLERSRHLGIPLQLLPYQQDRPQAQRAGTLTIWPVTGLYSSEPGQLHKENSPYVIETLAQACDACAQQYLDALVTGPVHKEIINAAGVSFSGHTEFFAQRLKTEQVVMMLAADALRVALVTTHLPLADVPQAITAERLTRVIRILHHDLVSKFHIQHPRILVCGLNPHAGEGGYLGHEEIDTITPTLEQLRIQEGMDLQGPFPADTIFQPHYLEQADAVLAMYHDQGLPVLKFYGFGKAVNITLGLPIIRTSVDHGTAVQLAGTGQANPGSFIAAVQEASRMITSR